MAVPPQDHPVIVALRTHQQRVVDLGGWLQGSEFADERGWLSSEEAERFAREKDGWPTTLRALRDHVRRVREDHPEAFLAWVDAEIEALDKESKEGRNGRSTSLSKLQRQDYLQRWREIRAGNREDFYFGDFPDGPAPDVQRALCAIAGEPVARAAWQAAPIRIRSKTLRSVLGLSKAIPSRWVKAGCPVERKGRAFLFNPVDVLGWLDEQGYPEDLGPARALLRFAHHYDPHGAYRALCDVVATSQEWSGREDVIEGSCTDGLAPLLKALDNCRFALILSPLPFRGLEDIAAELRWVLADALIAWATGSPKPSVRIFKPLERWRVGLTLGSPHGGLYELEQEHFWDVVNWQTKERVLSFKGESDQSYTGEGDGWTDATWEGTQDVKISEDGKYAVVVDADGAARHVPLLPEPSPKETY